MIRLATRDGFQSGDQHGRWLGIGTDGPTHQCRAVVRNVDGHHRVAPVGQSGQQRGLAARPGAGRAARPRVAGAAASAAVTSCDPSS